MSAPKLTAMNRSQRLALAQTTLQSTIPALLSSNRRALDGTASSTLYQRLPALPPGENTFPIRLVSGDTYTTGHSLQLAHPGDRVAVLNMASPYKPGGGFLTGALAQEESLCMRSTLYRALTTATGAKRFHPMPIGTSVIYTKDVCVFRDEEGIELGDDAYFVDVLSSAMPKNPKIGRDGRYEDSTVRALVKQKIRVLMRLAVQEGVKRLVLGAWGCGAYKNPYDEVVSAFRDVLTGDREKWEDIEEVVFAVLDRHGDMCLKFKDSWGEGLEYVES